MQKGPHCFEPFDYLAERVTAAAFPGSIDSSHRIAEVVSNQRVTAEKPFSDMLGNTLLFQRSIVGIAVGNLALTDP